ncbi:DUF4160 domain-containing protein [Myxococcota bacterium]
MGRERRGGYLFEWWIGDHSPKHVHVYKDGKFVAKIQVPSLLVLSGSPGRRVLTLVRELLGEGKL